jgi:hypothetical protein
VVLRPTHDDGWDRVRSFAGRKRYPTLSDDETVGKGGAPGFVVVWILGVVGELLCMLTAFVGDIF